jgi:hypothetical protein
LGKGAPATWRSRSSRPARVRRASDIGAQHDFSTEFLEIRGQNLIEYALPTDFVALASAAWFPGGGQSIEGKRSKCGAQLSAANGNPGGGAGAPARSRAGKKIEGAAPRGARNESAAVERRRERLGENVIPGIRRRLLHTSGTGNKA